MGDDVGTGRHKCVKLCSGMRVINTRLSIDCCVCGVQHHMCGWGSTALYCAPDQKRESLAVLQRAHCSAQ